MKILTAYALDSFTFTPGSGCFEGEIASAVEDAISNKIREGIIKLESWNHFKYTSEYTALLF